MEIFRLKTEVKSFRKKTMPGEQNPRYFSCFGLFTKNQS